MTAATFCLGDNLPSRFLVQMVARASEPTILYRAPPYRNRANKTFTYISISDTSALRFPQASQ